MDKVLEFGAQLLPNFVAQLFPNLEEKTETLQSTIDFLKCRKHDVDHELHAACHSGKKRKSVVEDWGNNVENIIKDFENSKQGVQQSSRFYHVFKRQRLSEELERISKKATELDARSKFANGLFLGVEESTGQLSLIPRLNGQAFQLSMEVSGICKEMVNRCDGLLLALITMAGSMRGETDIHEWRNASEELKESCLGRADMEDEVLPILRIADAEKIKMASGRPGSCNTTVKLWEKIHLGHVMLQ